MKSAKEWNATGRVHELEEDIEAIQADALESAAEAAREFLTGIMSLSREREAELRRLLSGGAAEEVFEELDAVRAERVFRELDVVRADFAAELKAVRAERDALLKAAHRFLGRHGGTDNGHCRTCRRFSGECDPVSCSQQMLIDAVRAIEEKL